MNWPKKILLLEDFVFHEDKGEVIPAGYEGRLLGDNYLFGEASNLDFWKSNQIAPLYTVDHFEDIEWTVPEFAFELNDTNLSGHRFVYTVYYKEPGRIFTSTYEPGGEDEEPYTREPTDEEMDRAMNHPLSARLRVELILEAGKKWKPWREFSDRILGATMTQNVEPGEA